MLAKNYIKSHDIGLLSYIASAIWGAGFEFKRPSGIEPIGAIWFLWAMFCAQIIYNCLPEKNKFKIPALTLIALVGYYAGKIYWLPFDLNVAMVAIVYLFIGESFSSVLNNQNISTFRLSLGGAKAVVVIIILFLFWMPGWSVTLGMVSNLYPFCGLSVLTSTAGSLFIITISRLIELLDNDKIKKYLSYMGRYSLVILCFHLIELKCVPWKMFISSVFAICLMKIILLSYIPILIRKIPKLAKIYKV